MKHPVYCDLLFDDGWTSRTVGWSPGVERAVFETYTDL